MNDGSGYRCWFCRTDKKKGSDYWQVRIITEDGQLLYVLCCCEICAEKAKIQNEELHLKRYEETKNQCIQRRVW